MNMTGLYGKLVKPFRDYKDYLNSLKQRDIARTNLLKEYVKQSTLITQDNVKVSPIGKNLISKLKSSYINKLK